MLVECFEDDPVNWAKRISVDNRGWVEARTMLAYTTS
jgi:hypothetical protein